MLRDRPASKHPDVNDTWTIRATAIYQRNGAVALTRSQIFDLAIELHELLSWAKDFEELDIEFVRLEIESE